MDGLHRAGLRIAWLGLRVLFVVARPTVRASVVLVRVEGRVLLLDNSYRAEPSFPGGLLRWREDPREGARRELEEEVGLRVAAGELRFLEVLPQEKWRAVIRLHVYDLELEREPEVRIDRREVVHAAFRTPEEIAAALPEFTELMARVADAASDRVVGFAAEDPS